MLDRIMAIAGDWLMEDWWKPKPKWHGKPMLVLYGAADRYNYGDNLMPILLRRYMQEHRPDLLSQFDIRVAAVSDSDLSASGCLPTVSIKYLRQQLPDGSAVIVTGGEVVGATALGQRAYRFKNRHAATAMLFLNKLFQGSAEFPYAPAADRFSAPPMICYNAVGGTIPRNGKQRCVLIDRLSRATYASVRDRRIMIAAGAEIPGLKIYPDSVAALPELVTNSFLRATTFGSVIYQCSDPYFVFQAAPRRIGANHKAIAECLIQATSKTGVPFVLLPIGYAAGHDDAVLLREVGRLTGFPVLDDLGLWEIMAAIKRSNGYFGTSLHGAITASAFGLPHVGLGDVGKLAAYLRLWSPPPYDRLYTIDDVPRMARLADKPANRAQLGTYARRNSRLAMMNYAELLGSIHA
jgi:hypothetical protein